MTKQYYVYIMISLSRTLYTGVTSNLEQRVFQHKHHLVPGFTSTYHITRLVYFDVTTDVRSAIEREKQIKGWSRAKKLALISSVNINWDDLSAGWFDSEAGQGDQPDVGPGFLGVRPSE